MYYGPVTLGSTIPLFEQVTNGSGVPSNADANSVSYAIYGPSASSPLLSGTFGATVVDSQTGFYAAQSVAFTAGNGFLADNTYIIRTTFAVSSVNQVRIHTITVV